MADGNFHPSPLPRNDYVSGVRAGEARMKTRILNILGEMLDEKTLQEVRKRLQMTVVVMLTAWTTAMAGCRDLADLVNPLMGTQSTYALSTGNTYPAIALPWGMNFWMPQTGRMGDGWAYVYSADKIRGFKQTHQPSPWINDYGQFSILPETGKPIFDEAERASWFSHKAETAKPYYYKVYLADYDVTAEITPTERAAVMRFTYPETDEAFAVVDAFDRGSSVRILPEQRRIVGYTTRNSGGVTENFRNWFVVEFDRPFTYTAAVVDGEVKDSTSSENPLEFIFGLGYLLPEFEKNIKDLEPRGKFEFTLSPENGYGVYDHVITNQDLELWMNGNHDSRIPETPQTVGFVHCVGSRDLKAGNSQGSKVCCTTAVKQAIEMKERFPELNVYCFYMDLRLFGKKYEDFYINAQRDFGVHFVRGRVSEVSETIDGRLQVKAEDTLVGKPVKLQLDLLVLMAGMVRNTQIDSFAEAAHLEVDQDGFLKSRDNISHIVESKRQGVFYAGACTGTKTVPETIAEARAAALNIYLYLQTL